MSNGRFRPVGTGSVPLARPPHIGEEPFEVGAPPGIGRPLRRRHGRLPVGGGEAEQADRDRFGGVMPPLQ